MTGRINGPLLLAGCGKMGGALLRGWLARGVEGGVDVLDPALAQAGLPPQWAGGDVRVYATAAALPPRLSPRFLVLAVKPQVMAAALPDYVRFAANGATVLSIAAGLPIAFFHARLGPGAAVIRAMPNTPAAIGQGITACCRDDRVSDAALQGATALLRAVGDVVVIAEEALMDAVTAVSGSGPAYLFLLLEGLIAAGVKAGLPPDVADRLARATVAGAGQLALQDGADAATLRRAVTSPGGTTEAALAALMPPGAGLPELLDRAVQAAVKRGRELGGG